MIILKKTPDPKNRFDKTSVEFIINDEELKLGDLLEEMKRFIISCGYIIKDSQELTFIDNREVDEECW